MVGRLSRRTALILGTGAVGGLFLGVGSSALAATETIADAWSQLIGWQSSTGWWAAPVHVSLRLDGSLLFHGDTRSDRVSISTTQQGIGGFTMVPSPPSTSVVTVALLNEPLDVQLLTQGNWTLWDNLLCAGHAHMSDGSVFIAGGTRTMANTSTNEYYAEGLGYGVRASVQGWARISGNMVAAPEGEVPVRWYPTVTRLADGRMLITSGALVVLPFAALNLTAESYSPATGAWTIVSTAAQTPSEIWNRDYTHTFLLPRTTRGFDLLSLGEPGVGVLHTAGTPATWQLSQTYRPGSSAYQAIRLAKGTFSGVDGPNFGASTVLLPIRVKNGEWGYSNGSILTVGGPEASVQSHSADIYDPALDSWHTSIDIGAQRHYPSTVLLPTGQVLIVNGTSSDDGVTGAHYINPMDNFSSYAGADTGGDLRGYHNIAILLPDGRVLVGGGRDANDSFSSERADFRYYYPTYMFATRPTLTGAPTSMIVGTTFTITVHGNQPMEFVLTALGSMTHSVDMDQRWVQLQLISVRSDGKGGYVCSVAVPATTQVTPPGPYLLWVLDAWRTPSLGSMVTLSAGVTPQTTTAVAQPARLRPITSIAGQVARIKQTAPANAVPAARLEFHCPLPLSTSR